MKYIEEKLSTPVTHDFEVIVCGGGPAGVAAALAAARRGARTALVETNGCLGGTWTAGLVSHIIDHQDKDGIIREICLEMTVRKGKGLNEDYDPEMLKALLEEMVGRENIFLRYHTMVAAAVKSGKRLTHVILESKSRREAWSGKVFIDATGDGDLAAMAGCQFDFGRPEDGMSQPFSMIAMLGGLNAAQISPYYNHPESRMQHKQRLCELLSRHGATPSYAAPTLFHLSDDLFLMMSTHFYGGCAFNADDLTAATVTARAEILCQVNALRKAGMPWANIRLLATSARVGVREGRRIHCRYMVSRDDLATGKKHHDAVCRVNFGVDIHSPDPEQSKEIYRVNRVDAKPYDIPYRALLPLDVDGLLVAGRCIGGDFQAHASYRVTGNACVLGEVAGRAAADAIKGGFLPHELPTETTLVGIIPT